MDGDGAISMREWKATMQHPAHFAKIRREKLEILEKWRRGYDDDAERREAAADRLVRLVESGAPRRDVIELDEDLHQLAGLGGRS